MALAAIALTVNPANAAVLIAGTKIGLDFGTSTTTNWNNIDTVAKTIVAGDVVDLTGTTVDGVGITTSTTTASFITADGNLDWAGLSTNGGSAPAEFVATVTNDFAGVSGTPGTYTINLTGLSTTLRYNIYAVTSSSVGAAANRQDRLNIAGDATYQNTITRGADPDPAAGTSRSGNFHTFLNVGSNLSGGLTITLDDATTNNNPIINGILIETIPEPSSALLSALGFLALLRRRR